MKWEFLTNPFILLLTTVHLTFLREVHSDERPAEWMSGKFGMGLRMMAGDYIERHASWGLDWHSLVMQFKDVGASWVIINLSEGAYGTTWMAHHPLLYSLGHETSPDKTCVPYFGSDSGWDGNCQTAPTPSSDHDDFKDMMDAFRNEGIKVIVYVASQGPAMFKAGSDFAFDVFRRKPGQPLRSNCIKTAAKQGPAACFNNPDQCCSPFMGNWIKHVKDLNDGFIDYPALHTAFANDIIGYYADKYSDDIDGWWFDHASENGSCGSGSTCANDFIDKNAVRNAIRTYQPNAPIAFNSCSNSQKSPLQICSGSLEDFTAGHPKPLGGKTPTLPFEISNLPMVTSIEETPDGFFGDGIDTASLGHVFMPTGTAWNGPTISNVWTTPYPYTTPYQMEFSWGEMVTEEEGWNTDAKDRFSRALDAGGAWTWNIPRQSNSPNTYFLLHPNHLELVKHVTATTTTNLPTPSPTDSTCFSSWTDLKVAVESDLANTNFTICENAKITKPKNTPILIERDLVQIECMYCIIKGFNRFFVVKSAEDVTFKGLTFKKARGNIIKAKQANVIIMDCTFFQNLATSNHALIEVTGGQMKLERNNIRKNKVTKGIIDSTKGANIIIENSLFVLNESTLIPYGIINMKGEGGTFSMMFSCFRYNKVTSRKTLMFGPTLVEQTENNFFHANSILESSDPDINCANGIQIDGLCVTSDTSTCLYQQETV